MRLNDDVLIPMLAFGTGVFRGCDLAEYISIYPTKYDLDRTHAQATLMPRRLSMNEDDCRTQSWV